MTTLVEKGPSPPEVSQYTNDFICLCYGRLCTVRLADGSKVQGIFKGVDFEQGIVLLDNVMVDKHHVMARMSKMRDVDVVKVSLSLEDIWHIDWTGVFVGEKEDTLHIDFSSDYISNPVNTDTAWMENEEDKPTDVATKSPAERWQNFTQTTKSNTVPDDDGQSGRKQPRLKDRKQGSAGQGTDQAGKYEPPHVRSDANRTRPNREREGGASHEREGGLTRARPSNNRRSRQNDSQKGDVEKRSVGATDEALDTVPQSPPTQTVPPPPPPPDAQAHQQSATSTEQQESPMPAGSAPPPYIPSEAMPYANMPHHPPPGGYSIHPQMYPTHLQHGLPIHPNFPMASIVGAPAPHQFSPHYQYPPSYPNAYGGHPVAPNAQNPGNFHGKMDYQGRRQQYDKSSRPYNAPYSGKQFNADTRSYASNQSSLSMEGSNRKELSISKAWLDFKPDPI